METEKVTRNSRLVTDSACLHQHGWDCADLQGADLQGIGDCIVNDAPASPHLDQRYQEFLMEGADH